MFLLMILKGNVSGINILGPLLVEGLERKKDYSTLIEPRGNWLNIDKFMSNNTLRENERYRYGSNPRHLVKSNPPLNYYLGRTQGFNLENT